MIPLKCEPGSSRADSQKAVPKQILIIEREYGCGAAEVAQKAAERLGWRLLDRELSHEIARLARVDPSECVRCEEQVDSWLYRLSKVFWRGSYERTLSLEGPEILDADRMVSLVQQAVTQAAEAGRCVIVGRGAPYFLRHRADTFVVFLYAPHDFKVARTIKELGDRSRAERVVKSVDESRAAFIRHYFHREWPNRHLYHMLLNTAVGIDTTVDFILHAMETAAQSDSMPIALD